MTNTGSKAQPYKDRFELKNQLIKDMLAGHISLGQVGKAIRTQGLQMSQTEVCSLLGLSRQVVSDIENDTGNPRLDSLRCYFKLMGLEIALLPRQRTELDELLRS